MARTCYSEMMMMPECMGKTFTSNVDKYLPDTLSWIFIVLAH